MDTGPLRRLLTANAVVFLVVCVVFLPHHLSLGLYPEGMAEWLEDNQWLMWTAAALTVSSALAIPPLRQSGEHR